MAAIAAILAIALVPLSTTAQQEDDPPDAVAVFNQAQDLHEKNDLPGAIEHYKDALKILPEFPEAEYQMGTAQLALGKLDDAERSFRRAVALRPDWTLALNNLASVLLRSDVKERLSEAETILRKVLEMEPGNPPALTAMTELSLRNHAPSAVLKDLLTKITPLTSRSNPTVALWTARAGIESALGQASAAKSSIANALAIAPHNPSALILAADLAISEGDIAKAKGIAETLEKAGTEPDSTKLLRAAILAAEGKPDDALATLASIKAPTRQALTLKDKIVTGRSSSAVDLEKQLESDQKNALILGKLCTAYRRDDPPKALEYCRRASEAEPSNINHAVGFGAALVQAHQYDAAVNVLRKLIGAAPDNATAHANLATALFQLKRYEDAKAEFGWMVSAQPKAAGPYYFLGIIHDQLGEYADAAANYQEYLRLADPAANKLDIERVNLRMPAIQKLVSRSKGKKK
jgi:protein O-GlcNAc transferase